VISVIDFFDAASRRHNDVILLPAIRRVSEACLLLFFYEILVDSTLATRRIGEQKFSCLQFASSAHNMASEVMESFCIFV